MDAKDPDSTDMVSNSHINIGKFESEYEFLPEIINKTKNKYECSRAILVGHNAHFDSSFLAAAYKRNNIKKTPFHKFSLIDTVSLGVLATGQTVLARICDELGIDYDNDEAHSAAYDTAVTAKVFCSIVNNFDN